MDKIKDSSRQSKQLEDLTAKMRECKRYVGLSSALWLS
jgi:novel plant SNARE